MLNVRKLYRPFHLKKSYRDIQEEKILTSLYPYKTGTLEMAISRIINEAVMGHMNLNIDSTIMQMLSLNEYLSELFMTNLKTLVFNYLIYHMEYRGIEEIEEVRLDHIEALANQVEMKTDLLELGIKLEALLE